VLEGGGDRAQMYCTKLYGGNGTRSVTHAKGFFSAMDLVLCITLV